MAADYQYILHSQPAPGVALITLNRPKQLNALFSPLFKELNACLAKTQDDAAVGAIVITGSEKSFAAGADIKEMSIKTYQEVASQDFLASWGHLTSIRKPILAAVNGFALGGGCELAMMCDIVYAGDKATFGQPEIKLGVIPGAGGTQRLLRAAGKSNAMEIILTGRNFSAQEALSWGLVSKIFKPEELVDETVKTAAKIAGFGRLSVQQGKEAINAAAELSLKEGLIYERRLFHGLFATEDQKEGMNAFLEKRKPTFKL
ncbi:ClpP/crotonase [Protomyces lactucae-debilis]|uniref:Probable enoyl-CoA hydratase, mitochondrial n=1 Tax=Protomyces lactucae-debilis TaxID=2754530 RepID=A0A1Y2FUI4_PROLT|nr:ClpP/crotonase [Protomyces lactucae-debilis]ORY87658.1 ClpP/crotonase [Protomyces lactucae-debilis]